MLVVLWERLKSAIKAFIFRLLKRLLALVAKLIKGLIKLFSETLTCHSICCNFYLSISAKIFLVKNQAIIFNDWNAITIVQYILSLLLLIACSYSLHRLAHLISSFVPRLQHVSFLGAFIAVFLLLNWVNNILIIFVLYLSGQLLFVSFLYFLDVFLKQVHLGSGYCI